MDQKIQELARLLQTIELSQPAFGSSFDSFAISARQTQTLIASILEKFAAFIREQLDSVLPSKPYCLDVLEKSIDLAFTEMNRPLITALLKPPVKAAILEAAGRLYDAITYPPGVVV